jgi:hypothetical protein
MRVKYWQLQSVANCQKTVKASVDILKGSHTKKNRRNIMQTSAHFSIRKTSRLKPLSAKSISLDKMDIQYIYVWVTHQMEDNLNVAANLRMKP